MLNCPHCQLTLQPQTYEGTQILFCSICWGHWLDDLALATILAKKDYGFSREERDTTLAAWVHIEGDAPTHDQQGVTCPVCGEIMTESMFADGCPVLVDRCSRHGTWLDAGEIKKIQVFVEQREMNHEGPL